MHTHATLQSPPPPFFIFFSGVKTSENPYLYRISSFAHSNFRFLLCVYLNYLLFFFVINNDISYKKNLNSKTVTFMGQMSPGVHD